MKRKKSLVGWASKDNPMIDWRYDGNTDSYRANVYACKRRYIRQGIIQKVRITIEEL